MCGILLTHGVDRPFHHGLLAQLRRRGPDALGFWSSGDFHLAHTRLSIIGLEPESNQPLANETHVLAFNGEIYNFAELKQNLIAEGVEFHTSSDSEVLLQAWSRWGREVLPRLNGFWAFAVYDKQRQTLTLVRDQLGIKPLYYWRQGGQTCAASLLRTVAETVPSALELDWQALSEYVRYQFTFGDKTFFKQIQKVLPGHCVEIDFRNGAIRDEVYEDILMPPETGGLRASPEVVKKTTSIIWRACIESTISDTSFSTFCSGGLDSSLITAVTRPEIAYHCNFSDPDCNETFYARQVVTALPTRLMVINANESFDLVARLASILEDFDEPTIGSVILPLDDLLAQVKRRHKVILTGTGGDELFGGYVRYQLSLGECYQDSYRNLFDRLVAITDPALRFEQCHRKGRPELFRFYDPGVEQTFLDRLRECGDEGRSLQAMLTFDRRYFLSGLLNIEDKLCGRHALEGRPSLLHQDLVRHVLQIAPEALVQNRELKFFLRQAAVESLPASVLRRTDKMGFTTPVGTFVNQSAHIIRERIMSSRFRDLYRLEGLQFHADNKYSREIFGLLLLDLWLERYAGTAPRPTAATA